MPFGGWFDRYYELIFKPAIEDARLTPKRADDLYRPGTIVNDIWSLTNSAKVLLADLTGRNPNVFYELGLAHALAKPVILVTESIEQVPFDLRSIRLLDYDKNDPGWGDRLRSRITKSILEVLEAPLEAVLPTFLNVRGDLHYGEVTERSKEYSELRQEVDLLRHEIWSRKYAPRRLPISELMNSDLPDQVIRSILMEQGVPGWLIEQDINKRYQLELFDFAQLERGE
jgi:hypothetical protein